MTSTDGANDQGSANGSEERRATETSSHQPASVRLSDVRFKKWGRQSLRKLVIFLTQYVLVQALPFVIELCFCFAAGNTWNFWDYINTKDIFLIDGFAWLALPQIIKSNAKLQLSKADFYSFISNIIGFFIIICAILYGIRTSHPPLWMKLAAICSIFVFGWFIVLFILHCHKRCLRVIKLGLSWEDGGEFSAFYLGMLEGAFERRGIRMELYPLTPGEHAPFYRIKTGKVDMEIVSAISMISELNSCDDYTSVMCLFKEAPISIVSNCDIFGKSLASKPAGSASSPDTSNETGHRVCTLGYRWEPFEGILKMFEKRLKTKHGVTFDLKWIPYDPDAKYDAKIEYDYLNIDLLSNSGVSKAYLLDCTDETPETPQTGRKPALPIVTPLALLGRADLDDESEDENIETPGEIIVCRDSLITNEPAVVQAFLEAVTESFALLKSEYGSYYIDNILAPYFRVFHSIDKDQDNRMEKHLRAARWVASQASEDRMPVRQADRAVDKPIDALPVFVWDKLRANQDVVPPGGQHSLTTNDIYLNSVFPPIDLRDCRKTDLSDQIFDLIIRKLFPWHSSSGKPPPIWEATRTEKATGPQAPKQAETPWYNRPPVPYWHRRRLPREP